MPFPHGGRLENGIRPQSATEALMFLTFPEDALWNAARRVVEFEGLEIGEHRGVVRVPRRAFQRLLPERPTAERCVEAYYLQRTRFDQITERKIRRRQFNRGRDRADQRARLVERRPTALR